MPSEPRTRPSAAQLLWRGLRRRCPQCGAGGLFDGWLGLRERCAACGLATHRSEDGYFAGAWMLNLVIAELALVAVLVLTVLLSWPDVPWRALQYGGAALMVATPFATFPLSRTLWLACDLIFRPAEPSEFRAAAR